MQGQAPSHSSRSTFGKPHEVQGLMQVQIETCIYNPEQFPKPNSHQLVRHTKKTISSKTW